MAQPTPSDYHNVMETLSYSRLSPPAAPAQKSRRNAPAPASVYHSAKKAMQVHTPPSSAARRSPPLAFLLPNNDSGYFYSQQQQQQQPVYYHQNLTAPSLYYAQPSSQITTATINQVFSPTSNCSQQQQQQYYCGQQPFTKQRKTLSKKSMISKRSASSVSLNLNGLQGNLMHTVAAIEPQSPLDTTPNSQNNYPAHSNNLLPLAPHSPAQKAAQLRCALQGLTLEQTTIAHLKALAKQFGISRSGKKTELFERLHAANEEFFCESATSEETLSDCLVGSDQFLPKCIGPSVEQTPKMMLAVNEAISPSSSNLQEFEKIFSLSPLSSFYHFDASLSGAAANGQSGNSKEDASIYNFVFKNSD